MNPKMNIAFLGLGTMGIGMVRRLLKSNQHQITVFNRNPDKAAPLAAEGARIAKSAREAATGAQVVIAMLADDVASRGIWLGADGALAGMSKGTIALDASTLTVAWVRQFAAACSEKGVTFLDAPVTGTKPHAANGELTFLVGGDAAALETVRPILALMSKEIIHLGATGSGAALKLINNFVCGVQAAALAEAFALITREKLDPAKALPLLLNGAPGSPLCKTLAMRHTTSDPTIYFQLQLMAKDLRYAVGEAKTHGLNLATAQAAQATFDAATAAGLGEGDMSGIIKYLA